MFIFANISAMGDVTPLDDLSDVHEINRPCGVVAIREGEDRCWVNNGLVDHRSLIFANLQTVDQTAKCAIATEQVDGSFVLRLDQSASADVRVAFLVVNPVQ